MLIAGDAAHLMPVWQGQGYNSGVRDATNLAWKLTAVLRGIAGDALLDTYDTERRDHAKAMIDVSVAMGRILSPTNKVVAGARDTLAAALNLVPAAKRWIAEGRYKPKPRFHVGALVERRRSRRGRASPSGRCSRSPASTPAPSRTCCSTTFSDPGSRCWCGATTRATSSTSNSLDTLTRLGVKLISVRPSTQLHWDAAHRPATRGRAADVTVIGDSDRPAEVLVRHPPGRVRRSSGPTGTSRPPRSPSTPRPSPPHWPPPAPHLTSRPHPRRSP